MCVSRSRFFSAQDRNGRAVFCVGPVKCCHCVADASCHKEHTQTTLCLVSLGLQENTLHFILFAFSLCSKTCICFWSFDIAVSNSWSTCSLTRVASHSSVLTWPYHEAAHNLLEWQNQPEALC